MGEYLLYSRQRYLKTKELKGICLISLNQGKLYLGYNRNRRPHGKGIQLF